jgi:hypothetical protein
MSAREDALTACLAYDHWAREVARLTAEIAENVCPREDDDDAGWWPSCFKCAIEDRANWWPGDVENEPRPPTLETVAKLVEDCPSCSRLCALIAERKHARQRFGVAKRRIRSVARVAQP